MSLQHLSRAVGRARFVPKNAMSSLAEEFPDMPAGVEYKPSSSDVMCTTLANGMKVVSKESGTGAASAGFAIGAGSRFGSQGEALTLKHLAFKGTSLRSDIKFARDLESAGLTPMASVGRQTLLFGLRGDAVGVSGEGLEALAEAVISPKLVGWHISEVQAECVNAEINTVSKDPQMLLTEQLHAAAFGGTSPLGRSLFNSPSFTSDALASHVAERFVPSNMTLVGSGLTHTQLVEAGTALFGTSGSSSLAPTAASPFVGGASILPASADLTHVALAFPGVASDSPDFFAAQVFKQVLAAASPCVGAFTVSYADEGMIGLAGAAGHAGASTLVSSMAASLKAPVSDAAVAAAKLAVKTQLLVGAEDSSTLVASLAAGGLDQGFKGLDAVTTASVTALQSKILKGGKLAMATVGDASAVPAYDAVVKMF